MKLKIFKLKISMIIQIFFLFFLKCSKKILNYTIWKPSPPPENRWEDIIIERRDIPIEISGPYPDGTTYFINPETWTYIIDGVTYYFIRNPDGGYSMGGMYTITTIGLNIAIITCILLYHYVPDHTLEEVDDRINDMNILENINIIYDVSQSNDPTFNIILVGFLFVWNLVYYKTYYKRYTKIYSLPKNDDNNDDDWDIFAI